MAAHDRSKDQERARKQAKEKRKGSEGGSWRAKVSEDFVGNAYESIDLIRAGVLA